MAVEQNALASSIHEHLLGDMELYNFLSDEQRRVIVRFVLGFCQHTEMLVSPNVTEGPELGWTVAANAALVGGAQKTNCFRCVKWVYLDSEEESKGLAGFAAGFTTVRLNVKTCIDETKTITPGSNVIVHEFAHVLDSLYGITGNCDIISDAYKRNKQAIEECHNRSIDDASIFSDPDALVPHHDFQSSEQEFFAYSTEYFFTSPHFLAALYPALYRRYESIYGLNMAEILPEGM